MINRDNLTVIADFDDIFCAAISISRNQWKVYTEIISRLKTQNPALRVRESKGWLYHNGGYQYKEVHLNSFGALEKIEQEISTIPCRG